MMRNLMIVAAGAALASAGALLAGDGAGAAPSETKPRGRNYVEATPIGDPVTCVQISRIRETRVRDDQTIDFIMNGGQVYRNRLPNRCPQLGFEEAFSYKTSISQLCNVDIITVINRGGSGINGPSCGLGEFQPVELADAKR